MNSLRRFFCHLSRVDSLAADADALSDVEGHVLPVRRHVDQVSGVLSWRKKLPPHTSRRSDNKPSPLEGGIAPDQIDHHRL